MKLSPAKALRSCAMLCALLCLYLSASAAQPEYKVTLKVHQTELKSILRSIEDQTGLYFMFNTDIIRLQEKISIHLQAVRLEEALQQLFAARGISWSIMEKAIVLKNSQPIKKLPAARAITGLVTDESNTPLAGATLQLQGTNIGTLSNVNGAFTLPGVPSGSVVLQARFTGFKPRDIAVGNESNLSIRLERSVSQLDEAVVIAYGTATERSVTGAISTVKGEQIQTLPNRSFDKSLQGLVPGLRISGGSGQPGAGLSNMIVRGISTGTEALGGSSVRNPLIVIDGMPVSQDPFNYMGANQPQTPATTPLAQINPNDIAEITVLKDAAAIALYGSKASNGVILVTTKKGRVHSTTFQFSHQTDLSFRSNIGPKMMNQEQYLRLLTETYRQTDPDTYTDAAIRKDLFTKFPYRSLGGDTSFYPAPDWNKLMYRHPAVTVSNNLSVSGGTPLQRYFINLEYTRQDGILRNSGFDRTSLRINLDNKPVSWLKFGLNSILSYSKQSLSSRQAETPSASLSDIISPLLPVYLENGAYLMEYRHGASLTGSGLVSNPIARSELNFSRNKAYHGLITFNAEATFLRHFSLASLIGIDYMQTEAKDKADPRFTASRFGNITDHDLRSANLITTTTLRYNTHFLQHHGLEVMVAQEAQMQNQKQTRIIVAGGDKYTNPYLDDISSQGYYLSSFAGNTTKKNMLSQFAHLQYNFRERYYLTGSWRRDGASVFGNNNPWGNYWSAGGAWIVSSENFMQPTAPFISLLKLRGSIGLAGNSGALSPQLQYDLLEPRQYLFQSALVPASMPGNPAIKWEKTRQWNTGLQLSILKNRINLDADYYYKFTGNLIFGTNLPSFTGYPTVQDNIGDIRNSGVELSLSADVVRNASFQWRITANWSRNSNKLIKSSGDFKSISFDPTMTAREGYEFNSYFLPIWAGVNPENGLPQWQDSTGKPTTDYSIAPKQIVGQSQPKAFGALTNTLSWKGITCTFQFQYQYGGYFLNQQRQFYYSDGTYAFLNAPVGVMDRWQKPGDISDNPIRIFNNPNNGAAHSTRYLYKSDYLRFQMASVSWDVPERLRNVLRMQSLRIFAQGNNLALWSTAKDVDPDNINPGGGTGFAYPNARTFSVGVNTSF